MAGKTGDKKQLRSFDRRRKYAAVLNGGQRVSKSREGLV